MPLPSPSKVAPLLAKIAAWIMTLNVPSNNISKAADCNSATGSGCYSIFINGNLARVLLASYKITGNTAHRDEGLRWCDTFVKLQHHALSGDGKEQTPVGWWDTGYEELYIADTGTAVTALALCYDVAGESQASRRAPWLDALQRFERFVRKGIQSTPACVPVLPKHTSCTYDGNLSQASHGWIKDARTTKGMDAGGVGDGYYKQAINLSPYTISTALTGGVFYAEMYALAEQGAPERETYAGVTHGAVQWLLAHQAPNGTIPYIIDPPTSDPHEYQSITYSTEALIDLHLRFGEAALPELRKLKTTVEFLLREQGPSGALLTNSTAGEIYRSARAASLLQWWYSAVDPSDERVADAVSKYVVSWLQSAAGAATEGVASHALSSGFIGLVAADLMQPWATFVRPPSA